MSWRTGVWWWWGKLFSWLLVRHQNRPDSESRSHENVLISRTCRISHLLWVRCASWTEIIYCNDIETYIYIYPVQLKYMIDWLKNALVCLLAGLPLWLLCQKATDKEATNSEAHPTLEEASFFLQKVFLPTARVTWRILAPVGFSVQPGITKIPFHSTLFCLFKFSISPHQLKLQQERLEIGLSARNQINSFASRPHENQIYFCS